MDKTLYTLIVHSENIAGLLNQITLCLLVAKSISKVLMFLRLPLRECINILLLSGLLRM